MTYPGYRLPCQYSSKCKRSVATEERCCPYHRAYTRSTEMGHVAIECSDAWECYACSLTGTSDLVGMRGEIFSERCARRP